MSAESSGSGKPGSSSGEMGSTPEAGGVTEGKVDNACNRQAHSTPHCTQSQTNHTPIPVHTQSTDETNQDGASCHDDKGAKVGEQKDDLTSVTVKVSNSEQKCMGKSSYEQIVGTQCASNEDSESSMEGEDQSDEVESLGGKGGKQDKTFGITRSENDAGDPSNEAVQEAEKVNLEENPRSKSDSNRIPKGNEQKDNGNGAIPGDKDEKPDQKSGCNYIEKSPSVNENDIDDVSMQEAENENHDQNSELKHTVKRPSGNENDIDEGAMQRAKDEKHDQNNGNKDIGNRPSGKDIDDGAMQGIEVERTRRNEKDTDNKIRPSVENENNGDNDTEKRPIKYEKNDKGDITTQAVKEESPDINKKINNTKKESRENEKKDHPDNGTTKDQDDGTKSISQARNLELSDNAASILGDPDKPFNDSDGGTKESRDKDALPETTPLTQTAQPCNQMENYACHQDEVGATHSQLSHETPSSQSQDDYTILDKQLDRVIDEILTESNLKENIEEWKKSAREKIKNFFQTKVMDGTLSQRSFDPCATKSMPLQIFDSDIHITETLTGDAKGAMRGRGTEGGPISSQHNLGYDPSKYTTKQNEESIGIGDEQNHQEPSRQTEEKVDVKSIHGKKSSTPRPEARKPPLSQSSSPKIPAETNTKDVRAARREQSAKDGPSSSKHSQANDPTDPSKCTAAPDVEIPFIGSEEDRQGPPEQSTPQTKGAISLHESYRQAGKRDTTAMHLHRSLNAASSNKFSSDSRGYTTIDEAKHEENLRGPSGQMTLPDSSETMDAKSLHGGSYKKSSVKTKVTDMSEMTKDLKHAYHNMFLPQTEKTPSDSTKGEQSAKKIPINIQLDTQDVKEFDLPCSARNYFKWLYCLSDVKCLATLKSLCNEIGIDLKKSRDKSPVFMFPPTKEIVIEQLQRSFEETAKQHDIIYYTFVWDLKRPEKDLIGFCNHWNDTKTCSNVLLLFDITYGKIPCLVGERPAVKAIRSSLESELNRYYDNQFADAVEPHIWEEKVNDTLFEIFEKMKETLEMDFKVAVSCGPNSKMKVTATSQDAITGVIRKVIEISNSVQSLKLPYVYLEFLNRSESAKLYIEQQLRKQNILKLHFLENDEYDTVQVFEENNTDLEYVNKKIQDWLFIIPSTDKLCQIFSFDEGKKEFSRLVEENKGKVQMVLDGSKQLCCVGTIDVKEKIESTLSRFSLKNDYIKLPSEEVWQFCARHHMFQDIAKEASCEVKFAENWCVKVRGPVALISKCCDRIEKEIRKVKSETILSIDYESFDESSVANMIQKWNDGKRCFVNKQSVKAKPSAPWKKWIEKKGIEINMTYSVNLNSSPGIHENELKLVLIPQELTGARSKNPCDQIPGQSIVQISVPSLKTIDFVERGFKEVLKMNKLQWRKLKLIVDCERVPEKELKTSMKIICYTLDDTRGSDSCITTCEFCDTRLEMFECMTKIIDAHFNNKDFEVLEWRGRSIEIDIIAGQLAQQKVFDVLVNSTSWDLDLTAGFTSKSILKVAGPGIQEECKKRYKRGIKMGDIAITEGHGLNCKHVFHGSLLSYNSKENFQSLRKMIRKCLEEADKMKMESIAFPALGTGSLGYDRRDVANVLFEEVEKYENEVRHGSLSRLCCVIYQDDIDAVKEFQKRHKSWNEYHKVKNVLEEVRVTSDNPNVIEDIRQEVKQLQRQTATSIDPQSVEITENTRLGIQEEDAGSNHARDQIKDPSKKVNYLAEEKRCLLIKAKGEYKTEDLNIWERSLREDLKNVAENIVFPFHSPNQALVQFVSEKGVADILNDNNICKKYEVQKFPSQAVVDLKAVVSSRMIQLLKERRITLKEIRSKSGVLVQKNENDTLVLCGNILEIQAAYAFFASLVKDAFQDVKERITKEKRHIPNAAQKDTAEDHVIENLDGTCIENAPKINCTSSGDLKLLDQSSIDIINKPIKTDPRQTPSTEMKFDKLKIMDIPCTEEDVIKLKHFHKILMENVEVITDTNQCTTVLRFHDEVTKKRVIENLDTIKHLHYIRCQVPNTIGIKDVIAKMCSDDTFCYMSEDCQHIEIVGPNRKLLTNIKKELEKLPTLECQTDEMFFKSQEIPVFVTNEGISVFVKCASLLDLKTPVDAIVCPLSKQSDLDYGLPKAIADTAGPAYVSKLREMFDLNGERIPEHFIYVIRTEKIKSFSNVIIISTNRTHLSKKENNSSACESFLLQLMLQIFTEAERKRMKSIAIPGICSGRKGFTKGLCAHCYGTSVMHYSRTIRHDGQGLNEIHFVDILNEMTSYIESVFTQPELTDMFEMRLQEMKKSSRVPQPWNPVYSENGIVSFSEYVSLTVLQSKVLKETPKDRTLVYHENLGRKLMSKWLSDDKKNKLSNVENVYFLQNGQVASKLENVKLPTWNKDQDVAKFEKDITSFYYKIFQEAEKQHIVNMIMPLYGCSKEKEIVTKKSAECFCRELSKFAKRLSSKSIRFDMIITFEDRSTKDIIVNKIGLLIDGERAGFQPNASGQPTEITSKMTLSLEGRTQPDGHLSLKIDKTRRDNFKCDTIEIHVYIPNGIQKSIHPNPGKEYIGRKETLFLPDNELGRSIAFMIVKAFNRKILYDVQRKATQGIEMVTETCAPWISKKENMLDPKQLKKLYDSLKSKVEN